MNLFCTNLKFSLYVDSMWTVVMLLSAVLTHSDGTHLLQRIQSDVMISLKMSTFSANCTFLDKLFFKYELDMEI